MEKEQLTMEVKDYTQLTMCTSVFRRLEAFKRKHGLETPKLEAFNSHDYTAVIDRLLEGKE